MPHPVVHFEIMGKNGKKLQEFYQNLFGWTIDSNNPMNYGLTKTRENNIGIDGGIGDTQGGAPSYVACYAAVDDIQGSLDNAVKLGATVLVPVTTIPNMVTFCTLRDPEGNVFGMVKNTMP